MRLHRKSDLTRAFQEGRRCHSAVCVLHARRRSPGEHPTDGPRLAVIAGRPFALAVTRNRARRVLREASRLLLRHSHEAWDLVLVARPETLEQGCQARLEGMADLFRRAGVLPEKAVTSA